MKKARQINFTNINFDFKANIWFYYDVDHDTWLFLNGEFRKTNNLLSLIHSDHIFYRTKKLYNFFSFQLQEGIQFFQILFVIFMQCFHYIKSF